MLLAVRLGLSLALCLMLAPRQSLGFAYIFAGEANGVDIVTHPIGYTGAGGILNVTVGIDPTSINAAAMAISVQNVVNTFNNLQTTTNNLSFTEIAGNQVDFESTLLHELGHSLGLAHVNAATESGLPSNSRNYTKATNGANNVFDLNAGADGVIGSADDIRGDDINLNYFKTADNDPFTLANVVDSTTYSRDLADLPVADTFSANADRDVAELLGYGTNTTEAVMQQGAFFGETQRTLTADDVAGILFAQAGLDRLAGTADDYDLNLIFAGEDAGADILIDFDNSQTGFAVSQSGGAFISANHVRITQNRIFFNSGSNWFFNDTIRGVPEPSSALLALIGLTMITRRRR